MSKTSQAAGDYGQEEAVRYMLLIYGNERGMEGRSQQEIAEVMGAWSKYTDELQKSGKMLAGEALQPTATATMVRVKGDQVLASDGPYAETKEQLGGFYIIDAQDLDEAIEWAARMPHMAAGGAVEVRPVMEFDTAQR